MRSTFIIHTSSTTIHLTIGIVLRANRQGCCADLGSRSNDNACTHIQLGSMRHSERPMGALSNRITSVQTIAGGAVLRRTEYCAYTRAHQPAFVAWCAVSTEIQRHGNVYRPEPYPTVVPAKNTYLTVTHSHKKAARSVAYSHTARARVSTPTTIHHLCALCPVD